MRALTLADLENFLASPSLGDRCTLAAGIHNVNRTIAVTRGNLCIEGESKKTILKRGKADSGRLFAGPLIQANGVSGVVLKDLAVNGMRFEENSDGLFDHRHPLRVPPDSPLFCCARAIAAPEAYLESNFLTPFEADLFFSDTHRLSLQNLDLHNPIKSGIALANRMDEVDVEHVCISRAGDAGVWCGMTLENATPPLPLPEKIERQRPNNIRFSQCTFEGCGAPGIYLEASHVTIQSCVLKRNYRDFPYNHDGAQIAIDYKSDNIAVHSCSVLEGPALLRSVAAWLPDKEKIDMKQRLLRAIGIEAYGSRLLFEDNRIEGHSHEGIHLNGARRVRICGARTIIRRNHTAWPQYPKVRDDPRQNISVTATAEFKKLNAIPQDIALEGIKSENGVIFWSDGSQPNLKIHNVVIKNCDLRGKAGSGIVVCDNPDGATIQGVNWSVSGNRVQPKRFF